MPLEPAVPRLFLALIAACYPDRARRLIAPTRYWRAVAAGALACALSGAGLADAGAQDLPTDSQVQAAFGIAYNHLGLLEHCAAKGFASTVDVANTRKMVDTAMRGATVEAAARAQEAVGRRGTIVGDQVIGLIDATDPARPELVPAGRTMSFADNARAQKTSERVLCSEMAAQVAPPP